MKPLLISTLLTISVFLASCSNLPGQRFEIEVGQSREIVIEQLGQPDEINEFVMLDQPFYGPQESLVGILSPGIVVEEWMYHHRDEILYIWFAGEAGQQKDSWKVVETATYPEGAVY